MTITNISRPGQPPVLGDLVLITYDNGATEEKTYFPPPAAPTPAQLLLQAQQAQVALLQAAYAATVNVPVPFKNAAGVTSTYPGGNMPCWTGESALTMLSLALQAGSTLWTVGGLYDMNNIWQPMTYTDLQGLVAAMSAIIQPAVEHLATQLAAVYSAQSVAAIQAVNW